MNCIFGVDIVKGSIHGKVRPKYAVFILKDDGTEFCKIVSKAKLFRLVKRYKPSLISVDNISELFSSKSEIINFLKDLNGETKLIQITSEKESLAYLSKRYGIKIDLKNPVDEAKACAYLAKFGVGYEVSIFLDKTIIKVSRNRSLGKGGWKQNKYRKRIHALINLIFKEIKEKLDEANLEYIEEVRKGFGGISRGILIVNAPRNKVPVNSFKTKDVQVKVEALEKEKIELIPRAKSKIYTIVGIDPGTTTAVAILDLNGNLLDVRSKKDWDYSDVVRHVLSFGKPVVVATDKSNPPEFVLKLKASFQAVLHAPKGDLSLERKKSLTSGYPLLNIHERDALAAALDAYNQHKSKLMNIEKRVPAGFDVEKVKAEVLRGTSLKDLIIKEPIQKPEKKQASKLDEISEKLEHELKIKDKRIKELEKENEILKAEIRSLKDEIERLKARIIALSSKEHEKIRKDRTVQALKVEIKELRDLIKRKDETINELLKKLEEMKKIEIYELKGYKKVKILKKFTKDEIKSLKQEIGITKGDIILIEDCSGGAAACAEMLCSEGILAVIVENEMSHLALEKFKSKLIPVLNSKDLSIIKFSKIAFVDPNEFDKVYRKELNKIKSERIKAIEKLIKDYKNRLL